MILRLIVYDIENDNYRTKLANKLEAFGFVRLQYSVFCGRHTVVQWQKVWKKIKEFEKKYGMPNDKIYATIISPANFKKMEAIGEKPNFELILDELITVWM